MVSAFEQLLAEGYIQGQVGSGTFVSRELPDATRARRISTPEQTARSPRLSQRGMLLAATRRSTRSRRRAAPRPFRPGQPALDHFPVATWARIAARLYRKPPEALRTATSADRRPPAPAPGHRRLPGSGPRVRCVPEQVIVVAGAQQALDLVARVLLDPDDAVWSRTLASRGGRAASPGRGGAAGAGTRRRRGA